MAGQSLFRLMAILIFVSGISIAVYHRVKAHHPDEKISRKEEGLAILVSLRLFGLLVWLVVITALIDPFWFTWSSFPLASWVRWAGAILGLACVPLIRWVFRSLGRNLTDTVVTRKDATLVTHGLYRYVRHPLYVTAFLFFASMGLLLANWLILVMVTPVFFLIALRTPIEEAKLIEKFADEYRSYMKRTGRFLPRLSRPR